MNVLNHIVLGLCLSPMQTSLSRLTRSDAHVPLELASRDILLKHLINLFECTILGFGNEEEEKDETSQVGAEPDITVLGALK